MDGDLSETDSQLILKMNGIATCFDGIGWSVIRYKNQGVNIRRDAIITRKINPSPLVSGCLNTVEFSSAMEA